MTAAFPAAELFSTTHRILPNGRNQLLGDLAAFEEDNWDGAEPDVEVGPDGAYDVSELTGFPFTPGAARVWRVEPGRSTPAICSTFAFVPNDGCEVQRAA